MIHARGLAKHTLANPRYGTMITPIMALAIISMTPARIARPLESRSLNGKANRI